MQTAEVALALTLRAYLLTLVHRVKHHSAYSCRIVEVRKRSTCRIQFAVQSE